MDIKQLLKTTPETLALQQYNALLNEAADRLRLLANHIESGDLGEALNMLKRKCPAGDGNGCDNSCIDFSDVIEPCQQGCPSDISDVINKLSTLWTIIPKRRDKS